MYRVDVAQDSSWEKFSTLVELVPFVDYPCEHHARIVNERDGAINHAWVLRDPWRSWLAGREYQLSIEARAIQDYDPGTQTPFYRHYYLWLEFTDIKDALLFKLTWGGR